MELTTDQQIQLWYHYEQIAMHFNELIMRYRIQLMGGAGAISAVGFFLVQGKNISGPERRAYRALLSSVLLLLVSAAAFLDYQYYYQLLGGSVDALLAFEKNNPHINMSTMIHNKVKDDADQAILFWYGAMIVPLFLFTFWSIIRFWSMPKTGDD